MTDVPELFQDQRLTAFQRTCLMDIHALVQERGAAVAGVVCRDRLEMGACGGTPAVEIHIPERGVEIWVYAEGARFRTDTVEVHPAMWDFPNLHQFGRYFVEELARRL